MSITLRASKAAVEDTYEHFAPLVKKIAHRFARQFHRDVEETEADANVAFLEAYHGFDRERNPSFESRLQTVIRSRLLDKVRKETHYRSKYRLERVEVDLDSRTIQAIEPYDREGLLRSVGKDARKVLELLFDSPDDLADAIQSARHPSNRKLKGCLRRFLMERLGWASKQVWDSFGEIREALS